MQKKKAKKDKKAKKEKDDKKKKKKDVKKKKKEKKGKKAKDKKAKGKKDKKAKKAKKAKKEKGKNKGLKESCTAQFGKYGIIKAEDFFNKKPEFLMWATEVKKALIDTMGQMQQKDLFKDYIEDYNTATMPIEKYYDLNAWDKKMSVKRQKKNKGDEMSEAQRASLASFDDESARKHEMKAQAAKKQEEQLQGEVRRMRGDKLKVEAMRAQGQLRTQLDMMQRAGNTKEADKLKSRLDSTLDDFGRKLTPMTASLQKMRTE